MKNTFTKAVFCAVVWLQSLPSVSAAQLESWRSHIGLYLGSKQLEERDWSPHDRHDSVGMLLDFQHQQWPLAMAVDLFGTGKTEDDADSRRESCTAEAHLGLRKVFEFSEADCLLRPYLGGGLALGSAEQTMKEDGVTSKADNTGRGFWVGTGAYVSVSPKLLLGLDLRYSQTELRLSGDEREAGGLLSTVGLAYIW
ncbi:MAG: hypothetical protein ACPGSC_03825 [Granulosicoccaceae bacterium]